MERLGKTDGKLYLEVGGHLLHDGHASRVLPGFDPRCKLDMLRSLPEPVDVLLCVSAADVAARRVWTEGETYEETAARVVRDLEAAGLPRAAVVFNMWKGQPEAEALRRALGADGLGARTYVRRWIEGYPDELARIVSEDGYGRDDHVPTAARVVLVVGLGSNCGKLSTCLGQVYLDRRRLGVDSAYAKLELFPVWNVDAAHPINLAYEAATADLLDRVVVDPFHREAYGVPAVNYNRDVDAFPILRDLIERVCAPGSFMRASYRSPTDMGVNMAGFAVTDEAACAAAAVAEIRSRVDRFQALADAGKGRPEWAETCRALLARAQAYRRDAGAPFLLDAVRRK